MEIGKDSPIGTSRIDADESNKDDYNNNNKKVVSNVAEKRKYFYSLSSKRVNMSESPTKKKLLVSPSIEEKIENITAELRKERALQNGDTFLFDNNTDRVSAAALLFDRSPSCDDSDVEKKQKDSIIEEEEELEGADGDITDAEEEEEEEEEADIIIEKSNKKREKKKKKKRKKRRSKKDERLYKGMVESILALETQIITKRKKNGKLENRLKDSLDDLSYLEERLKEVIIRNIRSINNSEVVEEVIEDNITLDDEDNEDVTSNDGMNDDIEAKLKMNIELKELRMKLRMEKEKHQFAKDEVSKLQQQCLESKSKREDLKKELNFYTAKSAEIQRMQSDADDTDKAVKAKLEMTTEIVELKNQLEIMVDTTHQLEKKTALLKSEKKSNDAVVSELNLIINPTKLWHNDDIRNAMDSLQNGDKNIDKNKAQMLTIKYLMGKLEKSEDEKEQYYQKVVEMEEQLLHVATQLEQQQKQLSPMYTFRRPSDFKSSIQDNKNKSPEGGLIPTATLGTAPLDQDSLTISSNKNNNNKKSLEGGVLKLFRRKTSIGKKSAPPIATDSDAPAASWCAPEKEEAKSSIIPPSGISVSYHGVDSSSQPSDDLSKSNHI